MRTNHLLRLAGATTVAVFMTVGVLGPVHAANDTANGKGDDKGRGNSANAPEKHDPVTLCHATGSGRFIEITVDDDAAGKHHEKHGDLSPVPDGGCPDASEEKSGGEKGKPSEDGGNEPEKGGGEKGNGGEGTTRVTVCHLEGNGSYHVLAFDDSALRAHLAHGDIQPVPAGGCPVDERAGGGGEDQAEGGEDQADGGEDQAGGGEDQAGEGQVGEGQVGEDQVLGIEAEIAGGTGTAPPRAMVDRAPAAVAPAAASSTAPAAGILPATGADDYTWALVSGGVFLTAGGLLIARRRRQAEG